MFYFYINTSYPTSLYTIIQKVSHYIQYYTVYKEKMIMGIGTIFEKR